MPSILITGGARSGKSLYAENRVLALPGRPLYIATAEARDPEMEARIAAHRARRGQDWDDIAAPVEIVRALRDSDAGGPRLVDCLTLWLSNLILSGRDWLAEAEALTAAIPDLGAPAIFVTNEVGMGIVPDNALAREFRDAAGRLNQMVAAVVDEVQFVVAGLPMRVK